MKIAGPSSILFIIIFPWWNIQSPFGPAYICISWLKWNMTPSPKSPHQQCLIYFRWKNHVQSLALFFLLRNHLSLPAELAHINKAKCKCCARLCWPWLWKLVFLSLLLIFDKRDAAISFEVSRCICLSVKWSESHFSLRRLSVQWCCRKR